MFYQQYLKLDKGEPYLPKRVTRTQKRNQISKIEKNLPACGFVLFLCVRLL